MHKNVWIRGAGYPLQALELFKAQPKLWGYILWPILLNLILGILLYWGLLIPGWEFINRFVSSMATASGFFAEGVRALGMVVGGFLGLLLMLLLGLILVQFGVILGAPWYGQLSEAIEELQTGSLPTQPLTLGKVFEDLNRAIGFELKKLFLGLGIGLLLLPLNLIPALGTILAGLGSILLAAFLNGLSFLDPPLERRRLSFRHKIITWRQNFPASGSFSLVCLALVSVPLLNLLTIPLCIAAGTIFYCQEINPKAMRKSGTIDKTGTKS